MPNAIRLVLPPNLNNTFLNNDFVLNEGENYFTGKLNLSPYIDNNKVTLKFGLELVDVENRDPVKLKTIKSIRLSNDPLFLPSSTITITDWPYDSTEYDPNIGNKVTGSNKNYIFDIDPVAFFDPDNTSLGARSEEAGNDLFIINNWPLSGNGGLSTVYFRIIAESIVGDQSTYPNNMGVFDQIYWQPESGIRPGLPQIIARNPDYAGRKALWKFNAANEAATALYGTGVARYTGDLIELRGPDTATPLAYVITSNLSSNSNRTLAPNFSANTPSPALVKRNFTPSTRTYASSSSVSINTTVTATLSSDSGVAFNSPSAVYSDPNLTIQPDLFAQTVLSINADKDQQSHYAVSLRLNIRNADEAANSSTCKEVEIKIECQNDGLNTYPTAKIIKRTGTTATTIQTTTLSKSIVKELREGGVIELYMTKLARPAAISPTNAFDNKRIVKSYFTPFSDKTKSFLLGTATLDSMSDWEGVSTNVQANVLIESVAGSLTYALEELAQGTARILLDVDLGDCKDDDIQIDTNVSTNTTKEGWQAALDNGTWTELSFNDPVYDADPASGSGVDELLGYFLKADLDVDKKTSSGTGRSYAELLSQMPTFSDRAKITFDYQMIQGQFYVALSPRPVFASEEPMGTRCDDAYVNSSSNLNKPTVMIKFDQTNKNISLIHRKNDNSVSSEIISTYEYLADATSENIEILVSNTPSVGEGLWIIINRNGETIANFKHTSDLPTARMGMGWHVAVGVRSQLYLDFGGAVDSPTSVNSRAILKNISITGLVPKAVVGNSDLPNQRHFIKGTGGSAYQKPLLGQLMLAGNTEFRDYVYKASVASTLEYKYIVQEFIPRSRTLTETALYPQLLEVMVEDTDALTDPNVLPRHPEVRIYAYTTPTTAGNSYIGAAVTDWIAPAKETSTDFALTGYKIPNNNLVQFNLGNDTAPNLTAGTKYWMVVKLPRGMSLARAKGFDQISTEIFVNYSGSALPGIPAGQVQGTGWQIVPLLWYKLFHSFRERYDNVFHQASLQFRVCAESHALVSSDASGLSDAVTVDISAPYYTPSILSTLSVNTESDRPYVTTVLHPTVRTTMLDVRATDADSGNWLFRVGKETDFGKISYTDWLEWDSFKKRDLSGNLIDDEIVYTIYHYGSWWKNPDGTTDPYVDDPNYTPQNMGTDGPRKVWVEVIDNAGNLSESYPITVNAQLISLVDTVPPSAEVTIIDPDGVVSEYTNKTIVNVKIEGQDAVSSVKDMRFRLIDGNGIGAWSNWEPYAEISKKPIAFDVVSASFNGGFSAFAGSGGAVSGSEEPPLPSGDPGTNPNPDPIGGNTGNTGNTDAGGSTGGSGGSGGSGGGTTTSVDPNGIKRIEVQVRDYGNNAAQPSSVWNTLSRDTYLTRNSFSIFGVTEFPKNILVNNSIKWTDPTQAKEAVYMAAIKFNEFATPNIRFDSVTWSTSGETAYKLVSLSTGTYNRKIFLGDIDTITMTVNGTTWNRAASATDSITAEPKFYVDNETGYLVFQNLPSGTYTSTFNCVVERSAAQIWKWDYNTLERVVDLGPLGERAILSMVALSDKILLGSGNGKVWSFDGKEIVGPIFTASDVDLNPLPISCMTLHQFMHETKSYIYIGTASKSYIFRAPIDNYVLSNSWERIKSEPMYDANYDLTSITSAYDALFFGTKQGKVFKYTRRLNKTNATTESQYTFVLDLNKSGIDDYESSVLQVSDIISYANQVVAAIGDRPEIHSYSEQLRSLPGINNEVVNNFFTHKLTNVRLATTAALSGTWVYASGKLVAPAVGTLSIDGVSVALGNRILIKNQASAIQNGIYTVTRLGTGSVKTELTRALDFDTNYKALPNTNVFVTAGSTNANLTFYLNTTEPIVINSSANSWSANQTSFAFYNSSWNVLEFSKAFVTDPAGWAWQFYHDGETNSRNKLNVVGAKTIDSKYAESGTKEYIYINGFLGKSTVFTQETGSDWEQAVNRQQTNLEPYTLEFEMRHESGSGSQGFEIGDGHYLINVQLTTTGVTVTSGNNTTTKTFLNRDSIFTPYSVIEQKFPDRGLLKMWNFALTDSIEDTNPIQPEGQGVASVQDWGAVEFCTVAAKTTPATGRSINVKLATTANLDAAYSAGPEPTAPAIGAKLTYNTAGAVSIDGVALSRRYTYTLYTLFSPTMTYSTTSKQVDLSIDLGDVEYFGLTVGGFIYDVDNDRIVGEIATLPSTGTSITLVDYPTESATSVVLAASYTQNTILVKDQTNRAQNGIYNVSTVGTTGVKCVLTRSNLFDEQSEMLKNTYIAVGNVSTAENGTVNKGKTFYLSNSEFIVIGTSDLYFTAEPATGSGTSHYLEVTYNAVGTRTGDPIIGASNFTPFVTDTHTYLLVRMRINRQLDLGDGYDTTVDYATTANIVNLATGAPSVVDGKTVSALDLILVKNQEDSKLNGIYQVTTVGTGSNGVWTRSAGFNTTEEMIAAPRVKVTGGIQNKNLTFYMHYDEPFVLGTSNVNYYSSVMAPRMKLKTYWSLSSQILNFTEYEYSETPISYSDDYLTYMIKPSWRGAVRSLYFEFEDYTKYTYATKPLIEIDYVAVSTSSGYYSVIRDLTPVRLSVGGSTRKDIKLWVGNFEQPIIEEDDFMNQETILSYVRFGKTSTDQANSTWAWGSFKYHIGHVIPPVVPEVKEFYPSYRFPSAGGVRRFSEHKGTIWALTDGYYLNKITNNPDDRTFKAWSYLPGKEVWRYESPATPRTIAGKGLIRPFAVTSFKDTLVVSGQVGFINNQKNIPTE